MDFGDTLAEILRKAKKEQHKQRFQYGQLYQRNYYKEVREKSRVYYKLYSLNGMQKVSEDYTDFTGVCQTGRNVLRKGSTGLDVQEFLGHSAVSTTMNIYARAHKNLPLTIPSS